MVIRRDTVDHSRCPEPTASWVRAPLCRSLDAAARRCATGGAEQNDDTHDGRIIATL